MQRSRAFVFLLLLACGCYRYAVTPVPAPEAAGSFRGARARVTLRDGRRVRMEHVYVRGDSLRTDTPRNGSPSAVALGDIEHLQVGRFSKGETVRWTVIIGGTALLAAIFLMIATDPS
jgi:hypothetical protein